ncbi:MAG: YvcK family protein [Candidatus Omnitrophota bacterium]|nr:MAG: YvcK family protein [Candidatus Omnitrophota bacterium]
MSKLKWLYPGMFIKRWIFLTTLGIILVAMGFTMVISEKTPQNKTFAAVIIILGGLIVITGVSRIINSFVTVFLPERKELVDRIYQKRILEKGPRIVTIGGGTGLSTLLHGLKEYTSNITAIVTVGDDGGSSGRLREELNVLPPGDIRNCLVALADTEPLMEKLFQFRFADGKYLKGHNFGNLFITAMSKVTGDFEQAIKASSKVLAIRGNVIPATLTKVVLKALHKDGTETIGESKIPEKKSPIEKMYINPNDSRPTMEALEAIKKAHAIILGPGSLYTSIMPNLLIDGMYKAIKGSKAIKVYVCNVMTQLGETGSYKASDHINAIIAHTGIDVMNYCIVNTGKVPPKLLGKYKEENAYPVTVDEEKVKQSGCEVIKANVIDTKDFVRHDSHKLAKIIIDLLSAIRKH